jgi:hypothetical protein
MRILVFLTLLLSAMIQSAFAATDGFYTLSPTTDIIWEGVSPTADYVSTYGDEATVTYTLPWTFTFYGQSYSQITVDTNGNIWFGSSGSAHSFNLAANTHGPVIAAWNNDLSSYFSGGVYIQHKMSPDRVVVEWQTETYTDEGRRRPNTFETVLFQTGAIRLDYKSFTQSATNKDFGTGISKADNAHNLSLTSNYGPVYTLGGLSYSFAPVPPLLNVSFSGNGSGTVTSTPSGIACNSNCSSPFPLGTQVTLSPAASQYSFFTGWSNGVCSGTEVCSLTLNAYSTVTAGFTYDAAHQVQISGGSTGYYTTIQDAYDAAADSSTIMLWATDYSESLSCNRPVTVTLQGGYDSTYNSIVGGVILSGTMKISNGKVVVGGVSVK